ncbi:hypothetical protein IT575_08510 [bacterium]|nr:hypothetical protein [bacterium]
MISGIIRRYGLSAALLFVAFAGLSAIFALSSAPDYYSRTTAYVTQAPDKIVTGITSLGGGDSMLDEMALLESASVKQHLADKMHLTAMLMPDWQPSPLLYQFQRAFAILKLAPSPLDYGRLPYPEVTDLRLDYGKAQNNRYALKVDESGSVTLMVNGRAVDTKPQGQKLSSPSLDITASGFKTGVSQSWKIKLTDPQQIIPELGLSLRVFRIGEKSRSVGIGATQKHPELSARMVEGIMDWYRARDVSTRQQSSSAALTYIEEQIATVEAEVDGLRTDMAALLEDRDRLIASQQNTSVTQSFLSEGVQLSDLQTERAQVGALREQIRKHGNTRGYYKSLEVPGNIETDLVTQIIQTEQRLEDELETKTEQHPDVIQLQSQLTAQKGNLSAFLDESVKQLERKISAAGKNVGKFQSLLDMTPESSMELNRLTGEIDLRNKGLAALYEQRLEATLQKISEVSAVQVVDAAVVNPRPVRPRLGQVAFSSAVFGLIATIAAVLLLRASDPRVVSADDLSAAFGLPVLATMKAGGQEASELEMRRLTARTARLLQQLDGPLGITIAHAKPSGAQIAEAVRKALETAGVEAAQRERLVGVESTGVGAVYAAQLAGFGKLVLVTTPGRRRIRELAALRDEAQAAGLEAVAFILLER